VADTQVANIRLDNWFVLNLYTIYADPGPFRVHRRLWPWDVVAEIILWLNCDFLHASRIFNETTIRRVPGNISIGLKLRLCIREELTLQKVGGEEFEPLTNHAQASHERVD
jgi:hypothetical protein